MIKSNALTPLIKQWITDSKVDVGATNLGNTPDWLEKLIWGVIKINRGSGGNVGATFSYVVTVGESIFGTECGNVQLVKPSTININAMCLSGSKEWRINRNNATTHMIFHEVRHTWQYNVVNTLPAGTIDGIQDTDHDLSPEKVDTITVVLGVPFEDGYDLTRGDDKPDNNIYTNDNPYPWGVPVPRDGYDYSYHQREKDASRFGCFYTGASVCQ